MEIDPGLKLCRRIIDGRGELFCGKMAHSQQICFDEYCPFEIGDEQVRIGQDGLAEIGPCQVSADECGFCKVGLCKIGFRKISHAEVRPAEWGPTQISLCQVAAGEIPLAQVGPP